MSQHSEQDLRIIAAILKRIELFKDLDEQDHHHIIEKITMDYFPDNHLIFRQLELGDRMYIIKNGIVKIFREDAQTQSEIDIAMLGDNDFFGEMSLISEEPRNASARTVEPSQIFILLRDDFLKLISENASIAAKISSEFLSRLKENLKDQRSK